jgi:hypothetical protein
VRHLVDEARLADAGLAGDQSQDALAELGRLQRRMESRELRLPPDERRRPHAGQPMWG